MKKGLVLVGLCLFLLTGLNLWAQTEAEVTGTVTDASGAAIVGAKVTATNNGTHGVRVVVSDNAGVFNIPALVPGFYTVTAEIAGFKTAVRTGIELQVQQALRLDFQLQVGQVSQRIEVAANAIQANTENATVGSVIENERIVDLPLDGRNFLQLTALDANVMYGYQPDVGAATSRMGGTRVAMDIAVAGGRPEFDFYTIDGVSNTDVNFNTYTFLPSIDAIQEFKIMTGVFPAEFGRGTAQINVSTKPGTNDLHGALFEFVRNSSTDAQAYCFNFTTGKCPPGNILHQNQFGGVIGGPVFIPHVYNGRNKLFFMFDAEYFRTSQAVNESATVMTAAQRQGDYTAAPSGTFTGYNTLYDPATRVLDPTGKYVTSVQTFASECGANVIPNGTNCEGQPNRINPDSAILMATQWLPMPTTTALNSQNLFDSFPSKADNSQYTTRIDFNQSTDSSWFGRYSWTNEVSTLIKGAAPETNDFLKTYAKQFVFSNVHTFSPTLVNDARFGYNRLLNGVLNFNANTNNNVVGQLNFTPGVVTPPSPEFYGLPGIGPADVSSWGDDTSIAFLLWDNTFEFADTVAKVHGKHSFRFGADIRRDQNTTAGNSFLRGSFSFAAHAVTSSGPQLPGSALASNTGGLGSADFLLGMNAAICAAGGPAQTALRNTSQAYFIDDTWKVSKKLTVNMGVRYEYIDPDVERHDNIANIWFPPPGEGISGINIATGGAVNGSPEVNQAVLIRPGNGPFYQNIPVNFQFGAGLLYARTSSLPCMQRALYCVTKTPFAPRLGIAYNPTPNWVIRAGAGMYYTQDMADYFFDTGRNLAARRQIPYNAAAPNLSFQNLTGGGFSSVNNPFVLAEGPYMKTPYIYQYLFDVQRQLTPNMLLTVGYMGDMGHSLWKVIDNNDPPVPGPGAVNPRRPYPAFGVIQSDAPFVSQNYNGLSVRLERKFAGGFSLNQVYTYSKDIDDGSAVREHSGDSLFPQNPYDLNADRGLSNLDIRHRAVTSIVYELPVGKGRKWMNQGGVADYILGGWETGGFFTASTGFPTDLISSADQVNDGEGGYDRPSYSGTVPSHVANGTIHEWFNPAAYTITFSPTPTAGQATCATAPYCYGNVGRNTVISPWLGDLDMNVMKKFTIHERMYLQLRFEAFNVTNHPNFGLPNANISNTSTFGTITGTNTNMRQLQLGLKLVW